MLPAKRSAGVVPEVSLRIPLDASEGYSLALKPRADIIRNPKQGYPKQGYPKQGYQWPHKKD